MILDKLSNSSTYDFLGERFKKAFEYLKNTDLESLEVGRYEIEGKEIYVLIQEYDTRPLAEGKWESHTKYADIQFIIKGTEIMYYSPLEFLDEYQRNDEKDVMNYKSKNEDNTYLIVGENMYGIFLPEDGHMPCISPKVPCKVKKAVVKILL